MVLHVTAEWTKGAQIIENWRPHHWRTKVRSLKDRAGSPETGSHILERRRRHFRMTEATSLEGGHPQRKESLSFGTKATSWEERPLRWRMETTSLEDGCTSLEDGSTSFEDGGPSSHPQRTEATFFENGDHILGGQRTGKEATLGDRGTVIQGRRPHP